jgi:hypothetical protein
MEHTEEFIATNATKNEDEKDPEEISKDEILEEETIDTNSF